MPRLPSPFRAAALTALLALSACWGGEEEELNRLDKEILANEADPALTSALEDQILVDPTLSQQSNRLAVRPPARPVQAQYPKDAPASGAGSAQSAAKGGAAENCTATDFDHAPGWARRLPAAFSLYPGARLTDAAGKEKSDCRMRVVTFRSDHSPQRLLAWYESRAIAAGYSAERQQRDADLILAGANAADGGAYFLVVTPLGKGGSDAALIANKGR